MHAVLNFILIEFIGIEQAIFPVWRYGAGSGIDNGEDITRGTIYGISPTGIFIIYF
jgi:hypothetical protein